MKNYRSYKDNKNSNEETNKEKKREFLALISSPGYKPTASRFLLQVHNVHTT